MWPKLRLLSFYDEMFCFSQTNSATTFRLRRKRAAVAGKQNLWREKTVPYHIDTRKFGKEPVCNLVLFYFCFSMPITNNIYILNHHIKTLILLVYWLRSDFPDGNEVIEIRDAVSDWDRYTCLSFQDVGSTANGNYINFTSIPNGGWV